MNSQNALPPNDQQMCQRAGGDSNIYYHNSRWRLAPGQALLIEATPPDCATWNLQISNYWMESLDYRYHRIHLNKFTASYQDDGSVRIVVAHQDPGVDNWIDTAGHSRGTMCLRWIRADHHPQPTTRVVRVADL